MASNIGLQPLPRPEPCKGPSPLPLNRPPGNDYPLELFSLLESIPTMKRHGYVMEPLTDAEINEKARCKNCNQTISNITKDLQKKIQHRRENPIPPPPRESWDPFPTFRINVGNGKYKTEQCTMSCRFHPGTVHRATKCFTCCDKHVSEVKSCVTRQLHEIHDYTPGELARSHQFYATPASFSAHGLSIRAAVAIDCEMGTAITGDSELIRLTAIDYLTGEILINNLVQPDQQMLHLNTRYSGVTWKQMDEARRRRTCLMGKAGAREALWRFVGPLTALVGHGVNNDLRALKWIHPTVIDSYMVEYKIVQAKKAEAAAAAAAAAAATATAGAAAISSEALIKETENHFKGMSLSPPEEPQPKKKKAKGTGDLALKTLMKKYLGRDIQTQGSKGHDSLEDALAARDLVHWMVMQRLMQKKGLVV